MEEILPFQRWVSLTDRYKQATGGNFICQISSQVGGAPEQGL